MIGYMMREMSEEDYDDNDGFIVKFTSSRKQYPWTVNELLPFSISL